MKHMLQRAPVYDHIIFLLQSLGSRLIKVVHYCRSLEFGGVVFDPVMRAAWDIPWMLQMAFYVFGLSLVAALYPARKAGRISPARAMRYH